MWKVSEGLRLKFKLFHLSSDCFGKVGYKFDIFWHFESRQSFVSHLLDLLLSHRVIFQLITGVQAYGQIGLEHG